MNVLVDVLRVLSVVLSLSLAPRVVARHTVLSGAPAARRALSPLAALAVVTGLVYVDRVLFAVYVLRVHGGDPSFVALSRSSCGAAQKAAVTAVRMVCFIRSLATAIPTPV
ncbi:hypothetical protein [Streptomyces collinus]|uniref:hypothetical protein n=1 Tax=Streptomyces collinus TaxID=42684 RepID=UPI0036A7F447